MTQEEKQLLLKDICERLSYGVKVNTWYNKPMNVKCVGVDVYTNTVTLDIPDDDDAKVYIDNAKPYLRPMSSMTDEEKEHLQALHDIISDENYGDGYSPSAWDAISDFNNYCREHHLDNGGLIGKGLALEAPEHMYD